MNYKQKYDLWLNSDYFDSETKTELMQIRDNEKEIEDRFHKAIEFGTAGIRGEIAAGTNRINVYVIRRCTQGLANYILFNGEAAKNRGVVIGYDSRRKSEEFAHEAAKVLAANGIKVYLFDELRPVPEISFAIRELKAIAGICITASHNPREYNGYKVYGEDGGQPTTEITDTISDEIAKITDYSAVKITDMDNAVENGLIVFIGQELDDKYLENIKKSSVNPEIVSAVSDKRFSVVYSPLNGSGNKLVRRALSDIGFKNVFVVKEQELPDPEFTTCNPPNPEKREVFKLAIELAQQHNANFIIATDPDADRLGVAVKDSEGEYIVLSGNQIGCLILEYILSQKNAKGLLPSNGVVVKTVVSTELARAIARAYGVKTIDVHVGFKNIGEQINNALDSGDSQYIFGFEESYGYLAGTHARDKDAVEAAMLLAETAAFYESKGMTLFEGLEELYCKYGYYLEDNVRYTLKGIEGARKIKDVMHTLRDDKRQAFNDLKISSFIDYNECRRYDYDTGSETYIDIRKANVLYFRFDDGGWFAMRPSGTEPLIKLYFGVIGATKDEASKKIKYYKENILPNIEQLLGV